MNYKKLPLATHPLVTSECWTYYKMAIIQTIPNHEEWLAGHIRMFSNQDGLSVLGEEHRMHPLSYYSGILEITDGQILRIDETQIIDYIINEIDNGNYLIIDANHNKLLHPETTKMRYHETLIYGYDKNKKYLITPILSNGTFKETQISFKNFQIAYEEVRNIFLQNREQIFNRRNYYYGITVFKPLYNYVNSNACFDFLTKLQRELEEYVYIRQPYPSTEAYPPAAHYVGLANLTFLIHNMETLSEDQAVRTIQLREYCKTCLRIYECQNILFYLMKWFMQKTLKCLELEELIHEYGTCIEKLYRSVLLFYKYSMAPNHDILQRITSNLKNAYQKEKEILKEIIPLVKECTINALSSK